jgi:hypothetical protein
VARLEREGFMAAKKKGARKKKRTVKRKTARKTRKRR